MNVHIGKIIEQEYDKSGIRANAFAEKIGTSNRNVYNIFERESIDTGMLAKISEALNHNFFKYYIETNELNEKEVQYKKRKRKIMLEVEISEQEFKSLLNRSE